MINDDAEKLRSLEQQIADLKSVIRGLILQDYKALLYSMRIRTGETGPAADTIAEFRAESDRLWNALDALGVESDGK